MKYRTLFLMAALSSCTVLFSQSKPMIDLKIKKAEKKVEVLIDGALFTAYIWPENIKKPVLWPVISPAGNMLTRSYPMINKEGERTDHPHHVGIWLNFGDVNGLDFWNNSEARPPESRDRYGTIYHRSVEKTVSARGNGMLATTAVWKAPDGTEMLAEKSSFRFHVRDKLRVIDRKTTLKALIDEVKFTDNKEGMFAIRVTRELELPSDRPTTLMDSHGNPTRVEQMDNTHVKGDYRSSEGIEGAEVWGTRARWMKLHSEINGEKVAIVIIDHPMNPGYPTYWHARGYGLFAANTLGQSALSDGKDELNFKLSKGGKATFRYRLVVAGREITDEQINQMADDFAMH